MTLAKSGIKSPICSVIIPSVSGLSMLTKTLTALEQQECGFEFEVIVIDRILSDAAQQIQKNYPRVRLISTSHTIGIPEMRELGISQSAGKFLVFTEDHCIPPKNWLAEIVKAHQSGYKVVGGAVENGCRKRLIDWAVFLCEYSSFMPPVANSEADFVTGNNTSYCRSIFEKLDKDLVQNYWEYFLQAELKSLNIKFLSVASITVEHNKEFSFFYFLKQRFYYSQSFAAMLRTKSSLSEQLIHFLYLPFLPLHQTWKIYQNVRRKKRNHREFFLSLPLLAVFMISYALGEFTGQIFGAGNSLTEVE